MFPGMNSRQAQQMMRRMGINQQDLDVLEVVVKLPDKNLVFKNPNLSKINMGGNETFQLSGDYEEVSENEVLEINDDDIKTVMEQANVDKETAKQAILDNNGDLAEAIVKLTE
jgi:nascent polypeptide-associated complex subunit alpha